jgi:alkanesulfonate monooxygenase SsuD/methylene tetrahydromethanopterin reductase-like flavin-dependent oxidoreductase (luciferase family)
MEIGILIEGQDGLTWPRWKNLAQACLDLGFSGLFRSDHFTHATPPDLNALELWSSLSWLADRIPKLAFGPLVSPVSFRHPSLTARIAADLDELSEGRLFLGLGAGWEVREHEMFGFPLLPPGPRMDRFDEAAAIIAHLLHSREPLTFSGRHYRLQEALLWPAPRRRIPIVIGGNGPRRTLPLAARLADEWNAVYVSPPHFAHLNAHLHGLILANGGQPRAVRRSLMTLVVFARTPAELEARLQARGIHRSPSILVGTGPELRAQIAAFAAVGVQKLVLKWIDQEDLEGLATLAKEIL